MINPRKLIKMARKWQKLAAIRRKRISYPRTTGDVDENSCGPSSSMANRGHFVIYTADQRSFMIPMVYLKHDIFKELFKLAEEEFGLPGNGPITLSCDSILLEYIILLIEKHVAKDLEKVILMCIATCRCLLSSDLHQEQTNQQLLICGF